LQAEVLAAALVPHLSLVAQEVEEEEAEHLALLPIGGTQATKVTQHLHTQQQVTLEALAVTVVKEYLAEAVPITLPLQETVAKAAWGGQVAVVVKGMQHQELAVLEGVVFGGLLAVRVLYLVVEEALDY
jgi:hypothetical protein